MEDSHSPIKKSGKTTEEAKTHPGLLKWWWWWWWLRWRFLYKSVQFVDIKVQHKY